MIRIYTSNIICEYTSKECMLLYLTDYYLKGMLKLYILPLHCQCNIDCKFRVSPINNRLLYCYIFSNFGKVSTIYKTKLEPYLKDFSIYYCISCVKD